MSGWSELIFGSMYCGKSEELIRRLKRAQIAGQKYQLFKPSIDTRYGLNQVATHENNETKDKIEKIISVHIEDEKRPAILKTIMQEMSGALIAHPVKNSAELLSSVDLDTEVVGIDEVQFFDMELINAIDCLVREGKRVIMAGLDMYASGEPWGVVPYLACKAKYVDKLHAVCVDCGDDAYISYKTEDAMGNKISGVDVGSKGKYIALCQHCAEKRNEGKK